MGEMSWTIILYNALIREKLNKRKHCALKVKRPDNSRSYAGPTSTYEKQPFEKGIKLYSNLMPILKMPLND